MIWRVILLMIVLAVPARAGHFTHDRIIGFSEDGRYFAFKTYGLQRGSGLPFANLFVIDLEHDAWVRGSPFRAARDESAMIEIEAAPYLALESVRGEALVSATPMLRDLQIRRPATLLHAQGIGQAHSAELSTSIVIPHPDNPTEPPRQEFTLTLREIQVPAAVDYCRLPEALRGYQLDIQHPDGRIEAIHRDQRIPASRACAQAYRLDAVVSAGYPQAGTPMVALISVWQQGFEGLERHVIAAPLPTLEALRENAAPATLEQLLADFLQGFEQLEPDALDAALPARQHADPDTLFWPDADLPPVARAIEVFAAQSGFVRHGRLHAIQDDITLIPEDAGGPVTLSLIRLRAFNLGAARREELLAIFGSDNVAPPEAFETGPHVEWRFVMRPVQAMRADIVAAGRREISPDVSADCGFVSCLSPEPLDPEAFGLTCSEISHIDLADAATSLGQALGVPEDHSLARQWLVEHGLWQADALQIVAQTDDEERSCIWAAHPPD